MPKLSSQKRASAANKSIDRFVEKTNEARSIINKTENQKLRNNAIRSLYDYESANINIKHLFERARYLSDVCLRKEIKFPAIGVKSELYRRLRIEEKALNKFSDEYDEALVMLKVVSNRSSDTDKMRLNELNRRLSKNFNRHFQEVYVHLVNAVASDYEAGVITAFYTISGFICPLE